MEDSSASNGVSSSSGITDVTDLERYHVNGIPETAYYVPGFISEEEEAILLQRVYESPKPKWTQLSNRRLQNWGGHPHAKGMIPEDLPLWLQLCASKIAKLGIFGEKIPNHVLVNEYLPGQGIMPHVDGPVFFPVITTLNLGSHAVINYYTPADSTSAASSPTEKPLSDSTYQDVTEVEQPLSETQKRLDPRLVFSLLLQPRSLLIVKDDLYTRYLHGIYAVKEDVLDNKIANLKVCDKEVGTVMKRDTRVSLTIRLAQNTSKFKMSFFKTK
ncbi:hypothetical protein RvY_16764 [Ramazzottius varieornatus]|uniref:Fe2OG dioxygenase domain-containing protein n=1 Tax=Ramazzottius varieornatus TaxID=947166 RepID=A0A1D1W284_RAMVA|nr:hypothetical protein RvY_16764 [Ramazzottius varieornatus]